MPSDTYPTIAGLSGKPARSEMMDPPRPNVETKMVLRRYYDEDHDPSRHLGGGCTYLDGTVTLVLDTNQVGLLGDPDEIVVTITPG